MFLLGFNQFLYNTYFKNNTNNNNCRKNYISCALKKYMCVYIYIIKRERDTFPCKKYRFYMYKQNKIVRDKK